MHSTYTTLPSNIRTRRDNESRCTLYPHDPDSIQSSNYHPTPTIHSPSMPPRRPKKQVKPSFPPQQPENSPPPPQNITLKIRKKTKNPPIQKQHAKITFPLPPFSRLLPEQPIRLLRNIPRRNAKRIQRAALPRMRQDGLALGSFHQGAELLDLVCGSAGRAGEVAVEDFRCERFLKFQG